MYKKRVMFFAPIWMQTMGFRCEEDMAKNRPDYIMVITFFGHEYKT